jgi:hypothetical protein
LALFFSYSLPPWLPFQAQLFPFSIPVLIPIVLHTFIKILVEDIFREVILEIFGIMVFFIKIVRFGNFFVDVWAIAFTAGISADEMDAKSILGEKCSEFTLPT